MRILIVTPYLFPHAGGIETIVDLELQQLQKKGHSVTVIASSCGAPAGEGPMHGARIIRISSWNWLEKKKGICWPFFSPRLLLSLCRWSLWCDAVHVHGLMYASSPFAVLSARLFRKRCVLSLHNTGIWCSSFRRQFLQAVLLHSAGRFCLRFSHKVTTQQRSELEKLRRLGGKKTDYVYLPNPIQTDRFSPATAQSRVLAKMKWGWNDERPKALFVGRINQQKGCDLLLQAKSEDYDLVFCGDGTADMLEQVKRSGAIHIPAQPHETMPSLYHACDVLVLPSRSEGQPMVVGEALLCGLPVVLTPFESASLFAGCRGITISDYHPQSLMDAILAALRGDDGRESEGKTLLALLPGEQEWVEEILRLLRLSSNTPPAALPSAGQKT